MRIGFDAKRAFNNTTGLGNYSRNIILALLQHYPNHTYFLYTPEIKLAEFYNQVKVFPNVTIVQPGKATWKAWWRRFGITRLLVQHKIDVYHGLSHELPKGISQQSLKKVVTIHDLIPYKEDVFRNIFDDYFFKKKLSHSVAAANEIVAISQATASDIIQQFNVSTQKVYVVNPVISFHTHDHYQEELSTVKLKFNLPDQFVLQVGRIEYRKNIQIVIKALKLLNDASIHYVVVGGKTRFHRSLQDFAINSGLRNQVIFLDPVSDDELACLYLLSKAVVYPSLYEGFGLPIVEGLSFGKPVLTTKGGCFEEAGGPGPIYCDTSNANEVAKGLTTVLNENLTIQIQEGQQYISRFNAKDIADSLIAIYEK